MLFSRIYNWIKYKTLPPSLLFANRLFVERDSKHRRVTSNLGLTFRNSKWSSYSRTNINTQHRVNYLKFIGSILLIIALALLLLKFSTYYNFQLLPSPIYSILWFILDADIYLKAVTVSSLLCLSQLMLTSFQNSVLPRSPLSNTRSYPKFLHKPILYSHLTSTPSSNLLEKLTAFDAAKSPNANGLLSLSKHLFLSASLLEKLDSTTYTLNQSLSTLSTATVKHTSLELLKAQAPMSSVNYDYWLFSSRSKQQQSVLNELSLWTLSDLNVELSNYNSLLKTPMGLFYLPSLTYSNLLTAANLYPELAAVTSSLDSQLSVVRQQRWLYRYNILHRSILKNSYNLTLTKKLIGTGFLNSSLGTRNIWASANLSSISNQANSDLGFNSTALRSNFYNIYGHYLNPFSLNRNNLNHALPVLNSTNLSSLSNYERSYHWFLQRFYQFNTLSTMSFNYQPSVSQTTVDSLAPTYTMFSNASIMFDITATSSELLPVSKDLKYTDMGQFNDIYLNYADRNLITKENADQLLGLAQNVTPAANTYFTPTVLNSYQPSK